MALLDHRQDFLYIDDYRARLVSQNQPPIVHETGHPHFKRLVARGRAALFILTGWGRSLYEAVRRFKIRRVQRELMWHGIPYSSLLEDDETAAGDGSKLVQIPVMLDQKWD